MHGAISESGLAIRQQEIVNALNYSDYSTNLIMFDTVHSLVTFREILRSALFNPRIIYEITEYKEIPSIVKERSVTYFIDMDDPNSTKLNALSEEEICKYFQAFDNVHSILSLGSRDVIGTIKHNGKYAKDMISTS